MCRGRHRVATARVTSAAASAARHLPRHLLGADAARVRAAPRDRLQTPAIAAQHELGDGPHVHELRPRSVRHRTPRANPFRRRGAHSGVAASVRALALGGGL